MKIVKPLTTLNAAGGTVDLSPISGLGLGNLLAIINVTSKATIYAVGAPGFGAASIAGSIVTLQASTAGMANTDTLQAFYDDGLTIASAVQSAQIASIIPAAPTMQNAAVALGNGTSLNVLGYASCIVNLTGAMGGGTTVTFEVSVDDVTFVAITGHQIGITGSLVTTATAAGDFRFNVAAYKSLRARISTFGTGSITAKGYASPLAGHSTTVNANIVGTLPAFAATPTVNANIVGTLPAFAATPTVNIGTAPSLAVTGAFFQATQPVSNVSLPLPAGAATSTLQTAIQSAPGTTATTAVGVQGTTGGLPLAASQSGTWTVQPGNTANTTPWLASINQGGNTAAVKSGGTPPSGADPALVVTLSSTSAYIYPTVSVISSGTAIAASGVFVNSPIYNNPTAFIYVPAASTYVGTLNIQTSQRSGVFQNVTAINTTTNQRVTNLSAPGVYAVQLMGENFQLNSTWTSGTMTPTVLISPVSHSQSNISFDQTIQGTSNGIAAALVPLKFRTAALTNAGQSIKASAGAVYGWTFINPNAAAVYVKFCDSATVTVGTTAVAATRMIPASSSIFVSNEMVRQLNFTTAISVYAVANLIDTDATAPAAAIMAEVQYV